MAYKFTHPPLKLREDFTQFLTRHTLLAIAQDLHDYDNFRGLSEDQRTVLEACKRTYKELCNGKEMELTYNCPA